MKLIASIDSEIGAALQRQLELQETETLVCTSRKPGAVMPLELVHPITWPRFQPNTITEAWYTIGINDARSSRMEVMQINAFLTCDFLGHIAASGLAPGAKVVIMSSAWGSTAVLAGENVAAATAPAYRMSKAALNMGVAVLSRRWPKFNWILMHPGVVASKMTANFTGAMLKADVSAEKMIASVAQEPRQFCFIDYDGQEVSF